MIKTPLPRLVGAAAPLVDRVHVPSALRYTDFRNYWFGMVASVTGYQMLVLFSLGWLIFDLTGDRRSLGYMSVAIAVPAIALNLFGGVLADKLNPKRLLGLVQFSTAIVVAVLAVGKLLDVVNEWHVLTAAFLIGTMQAFDNPTRQSMFARLVGREALSNAVALNSSAWTGTRIFAPAIAGIIISRIDISAAIFISAGGFLVLSLVSQTLRPSPVERARGRVFQEMTVGFTFIKGSPLFSILIGMTFFISFFGVSYVFLMPVLAREVLEVGADKMGWLMGAAGIGALTGIIIAANLIRSRYKGWLLVGGAISFGIFLILFAITARAQLYGLSMLTLFLGDMGISIYLMMVMTTLQAQVPDHFRGRVMGFFSITWSLAALGGLQSSQIAHYLSPPAAVAIGGALVATLALGVALFSRRIRALGGGDEGHGFG